jgi:hypothetical protein
MWALTQQFRLQNYPKNVKKAFPFVSKAFTFVLLPPFSLLFDFFLRILMIPYAFIRPLGYLQHIPTYRLPNGRQTAGVSSIPAISQPLWGSCMAGYSYLMPLASFADVTKCPGYPYPASLASSSCAAKCPSGA